MKTTRWAPIVAGGASALIAGGIVAARRRAAARLAGAHELFALRFRLSHEALRRNLDHFIGLVNAENPIDVSAFGELVRLYGDFLVVHHETEDNVIFPMLRRAGRLRTTDAAHLDRWTEEHRDVNAAGVALARAGEALGDGSRARLIELRNRAVTLSELLGPHLAAEEELINAERLREMVPARDIIDLGRAAGKFAKHPARMAAFYAHSLRPDERRQVFVDAPWIFRKLILPRVDRDLYRRAPSYFSNQR